MQEYSSSNSEMTELYQIRKTIKIYGEGTEGMRITPLIFLPKSL